MSGKNEGKPGDSGRPADVRPAREGPTGLPRGEQAALARRERQARALRDNLARRKAQLRSRKTGDAQDPGSCD